MKSGGKQTALSGILLTVVLFLSACAGVGGIERNSAPQRTASVDAPQVVVLPFENLSENPDAGLILTRLMSTEMYRQGVFRIREKPELDQQSSVFKHGNKQEPGINSIQQLVHKPGVDAVLLGSVTEYRYQHGLHEEPVVGLSMRMMRGCDGQVIWASSQSVTGRGFIHRDSLNQVARRVVHAMAAELEQLDLNELRCSVASVGGATAEESSL